MRANNANSSARKTPCCLKTNIATKLPMSSVYVGRLKLMYLSPLMFWPRESSVMLKKKIQVS